MSVRVVSSLLATLMVTSIIAVETPDGPSEPEPVEGRGIANLFRLGPALYSGSQPEGAAGFETLKRLGVRTIVSVDGTKPDLETARALGMRYVHLPIGYDGVPRTEQIRLVKLMGEFPGPVFVHCHHGQHRGPAAAAICGLGVGGWTPEQARSWLETAGTDAKYKGLYASVAGFQAPTAEELARVDPADLPEQARVSALVDAMVEVDRLWDHLKAIEKADFRTPDDQPDLDPAHEALMLAEQFREALRLEEAQERGAEFTRLLSESERDASAFEQSLAAHRDAPTSKNREGASAAFSRMGRACTTCHSQFRDPAKGE